jgi:putative Ca2+/H+ antiporter (TMEM165/GDT1 family)
VAAAFIIALLLVALAELGDKTQLLVLAFAARYRPAAVLAGVAAAVLALQLVATVLGRFAGALLPGRLIALVAGALFVGFGIWTWRDADDDDDESRVKTPSRLGPALTVAAAFFVAELGDKTQLMTVSIAADPGAALRTLGSLAPAVSPPQAGALSTSAGVWLGSSVGMLLADGVAIAAGALLKTRLPERAIRRVAAVVFVLFGLMTLLSAFVGG